MPFDGVFDAGILNCRAERVWNAAQSDMLGANLSVVLVLETNLVRYIHQQNNFTPLKRGLKYMDLYGDFKSSVQDLIFFRCCHAQFLVLI